MDDYVFVTVLITTTTPTTYNFSMPSKSQKNKQTNKSQKKINKQRKQARRIWLPLLVFTLYPPCFFRCHNSVRILTLNPPPPTHFSKVFPSHTMVTKRHVPQVFLLPPHRTILILHVSKESGR